MENASKALIMAGGVLIGVLILSLAVYLFVSFGSTADNISKQNDQTKLAQFNSQFTVYEGKNDLTIYDIISVAGYANENNKYYENNINYTVNVKINGNSKASTSDDIIYNQATLIENDRSNITKDNPDLPKYSCTSINYKNNGNGRVNQITFTKK